MRKFIVNPLGVVRHNTTSSPDECTESAAQQVSEIPLKAKQFQLIPPALWDEFTRLQRGLINTGAQYRMQIIMTYQHVTQNGCSSFISNLSTEKGCRVDTVINSQGILHN
jgi:hypothetical protein